MRPMVLYSQVPGGSRADEMDLADAAAALSAALPEAVLCGTAGEARHVLDLLDRHRPGVVFNACEAPLGRPELEAHVAALLEWAGVRFTGNGSETLALCRRKDRTNAVLAAAGVPVPDTDGYPCIVKPLDQDGSFGIDERSVCEDAAQAVAARARLGGPTLTQAFLPGREFVVALWGPDRVLHHSVGEFRFAGGLRLNTYRSKWDVESAAFQLATLDYAGPIEAGLRREVVGVAVAAWAAVGGRGYMRVDVRLDAAGRPLVLDVNPNPEIGPGGGMHRAAEEAGWSWERFVRQVLAWA